MRDPMERQRLSQMVLEFANTKHSIGDESIQFWMFEMERYYQSLNDPVKISNSSQSFYELARNFFLAKNTDYWPEDVKWARFPDGTYRIKAFR